MMRVLRYFGEMASGEVLKVYVVVQVSHKTFESLMMKRQMILVTRYLQYTGFDMGGFQVSTIR